VPAQCTRRSRSMMCACWNPPCCPAGRLPSVREASNIQKSGPEDRTASS
jgi:hypothetical protein